MMGVDDNPGIVSIAIGDLLEKCSSDERREYSLRLSFMEVYNETISDLLQPSKGSLKIHESISVTAFSFKTSRFFSGECLSGT
jgi:hypothetical protein